MNASIALNNKTCRISRHIGNQGAQDQKYVRRAESCSLAGSIVEYILRRRRYEAGNFSGMLPDQLQPPTTVKADSFRCACKFLN